MDMDFDRKYKIKDGPVERIPANVFYENLSWLDIKDMPNKAEVVIVQPFGSVEQHGPHGPLDMDSNAVRGTVPQAAYLAKKQGTKVLVGSLIPYGYSILHYDAKDEEDAFPGTIHISSHTYLSLVSEICFGYVRAGFRRIVLITGHGNNIPLLQVAARDARHATGALVAVTAPYLVAGPELLKLLEQGFLKHAEEFETSMALAVDEESVHSEMLRDRTAPIDMASPSRGKYFARDAITHPASTGRVMIAEFFSEISKGGVIGNPYLASKEKGLQAIDLMVEKLAEFFGFFAGIRFGEGAEAYVRSTTGG